MTSWRRATVGLILCAMAAAAIILLPDSKRGPANASPESNDDSPESRVKSGGDTKLAASGNAFIGKDYGKKHRDVHSVFFMRRNGVIYQASVRYIPEEASMLEVPGFFDIIQQRELPEKLVRVDQETEMAARTLGESVRSIVSYHAYCDPKSGYVVAYDMAQTIGGQPQRMIGYLTRNGVAVDVYSGSQRIDRHDVPFPIQDTFIPLNEDFIHQWYEKSENKEARQKREPVKFSIFTPEFMTFVIVAVRPLDDERIPIGDATYNCAHYEVLARSTQSSDGLQSRQEMWFDKRSGLMMKRQDFDPSVSAVDGPVMEREMNLGVGVLARLAEVVTDAPKLPEKMLPYALDEEMSYTVTARDNDLGRIRVKFLKSDEANKDLPVPAGNIKPAFVATAAVSLNAQRGPDPGGGAAKAQRDENAVTYFDSTWSPLQYEARGEENTDGKTSYVLSARIQAEKVAVQSRRKNEEISAPAAAKAPDEAGPDAEWKDPLKRVPITDEEAAAESSIGAAAGPREISFTRQFMPNTILTDYNRVEHLMLLAGRLPLPPFPAEKEKPQTLYQKAAVFQVRSNRSSVVMFEIKPEPRQALTERQKRRQNYEPDPPMFVATATAPLMPCKMLISEDGRLLELTLKFGSGEVIYTLDDPIMRKRAERLKTRRAQQGPRLVRPSWW